MTLVILHNQYSLWLTITTFKNSQMETDNTARVQHFDYVIVWTKVQKEVIWQLWLWQVACCTIIYMQVDKIARYSDGLQTIKKTHKLRWLVISWNIYLHAYQNFTKIIVSVNLMYTYLSMSYPTPSLRHGGDMTNLGVNDPCTIQGQSTLSNSHYVSTYWPGSIYNYGGLLPFSGCIS